MTCDPKNETYIDSANLEQPRNNDVRSTNPTQDLNRSDETAQQHFQGIPPLGFKSMKENLGIPIIESYICLGRVWSCTSYVENPHAYFIDQLLNLLDPSSNDSIANMLDYRLPLFHHFQNNINLRVKGCYDVGDACTKTPRYHPRPKAHHSPVS